MALIFLLTVSLNVELKAEALGERASREAIVRILEQMGYEEIRVERCLLEYFHPNPASEENNYFFGYITYVDVRTFAEIQDDGISTLSHQGQEYHRMTLRLTDEYFNSSPYRAYSDFERWVAAEFPESGFPYFYSTEADRYSYEIFYQMNRRLGADIGLNRTLSLTQYGPIVHMNDYFYNINPDRALLVAFRNALLTYRASCAR